VNRPPIQVTEEAMVEVTERHRERVNALTWVCGCGSKAPACPRLERLALAFAEFEREVRGPHGNREERCICPGCARTVPACWAAGMCVPCATEDCDCAERGVSSREAGGPEEGRGPAQGQEGR
jgi:hypothetical protein